MMLQGFPSAQSSITADSPRVYLFAVEESSLEAVKRACRMIVRGDVKGLNPDFPPPAPKLAQIVKECEARIKVERFEASHIFVENGSVLWEKMKLLRRDQGLLAYDRVLADGRRRRGWFFNPDEVAEADKLSLPPPIPAADMARRKADMDRRLGFTIGDSDGDRGVA